MRNFDPGLLAFLAGAVSLLGAGALSFRGARRAMPPMARALAALGWLAIAVGLALTAGLALAHLAGRLGPDQLWFRAPTFYAAAAVLAAAALWWFTRPLAPWLRAGLPAVLLVMFGVLVAVLRADGRSTPLAMLLPTMNQPAPDFRFDVVTGGQGSLASLRGQVVLLNFWATWCTPCRREMPLLSKMQHEHRDDGLVVLYVSLEEPAVLERFLAVHRFEGIQARISHAPGFYEAGKFYPLTYLIDRDGRVTQRWSGRPDEAWLGSIIRAQL